MYPRCRLEQHTRQCSSTTGSDLETLIKAKTGSACVVIIDSGEVKVVVEKDVLTDEVTMQIKDLVLNQGKFTPENITIFELNS